MSIAYINNCGLESIWDYTSHSAGAAGTGYINDYTGNLVWVYNGLGFSGNRMPVAINHVYNANDKANNDFGMGYGWRSNYNQLVYQCPRTVLTMFGRTKTPPGTTSNTSPPAHMRMKQIRL